MARQLIPYTAVPSAYTDPTAAAVFAGLNFVQENVTDHSAFVQVGRELLIAWNKASGTADAQTIEVDSATPASGYLVVTLTIEGLVYTSPHIAWNALATATTTGLLTAVDVNGTQLQTRYPGGLAVTGSQLPATQTVTFARALAGQALTAITIDNSGIGGGTYKSIQSAGSGGHNVTVFSSKDPYNRTADITKVVGGGVLYVFPAFKTVGWRQADNNVWFNGDSTSIWFAVLQTPAS
jgi:hypothetical protein